MKRKKYFEIASPDVRARNDGKTVGVLALQGDFAEHLRALKRLGVAAREVRLPEDLQGLSGLIIPGGESTTVSLLLDRFGLRKAVRNFKGAVWGTCAGAILMGKRIGSFEIASPAARARNDGGGVEPLGLVDIEVERNAYGRQTESFEADFEVAGIGKINGVFIRAPKISRAGDGVEVLASWKNNPVLVRQGRYLAGTFHTELTENLELHRYFLTMIPAEVYPERSRRAGMTDKGAPRAA